MNCKVCGAELNLDREFHYTAFVEQEGFSSPFIIGASRAEKKLMLYDCFDCPSCGCQNVAQERKYTFDPEMYTEDAMSVHSVYFKSEREAVRFLNHLKKTLAKKGFLSYWDYKSILNRPPKWEYDFGWTSLERARVQKNEHGWYLAMPAVRKRA